ncbi:hypothetical protein B1808_01520 [Pseudofulvimonas gallinarii]|nr:hypothetical protein B1808_01520 [Pseudofulvimonas gallinarii]
MDRNSGPDAHYPTACTTQWTGTGSRLALAPLNALTLPRTRPMPGQAPPVGAQCREGVSSAMAVGCAAAFSGRSGRGTRAG